MPDDIDVIAYRVKADDHPSLVEQVRVLFIDALPFLNVRPLPARTPQEQQEWWTKDLDHQKSALYVYSPVEEPWRIVAFSMVTNRGNHCSAIFSVDRACRNRGHGESVMRHFLSTSKLPFFGPRHATNLGIKHLHAKFGWSVSVKDEIEYVFHPNGNDRQQEIYNELIRYQEEGTP